MDEIPDLDAWPHAYHVVITAADERQAAGYLAQCESRRRAGSLSEAITFHVVTNPGSHPIGSGGMTLLALQHLAELFGGAGSIPQALVGGWVLIVHAGGESRRLPAYAAEGKVFTPLPCRTPEGFPASLFDLLIGQLRRIPPAAGGRVLVAAGDVLPTFDASQLDLSRPGVTGIAFPDGPERAARHGVYIIEPDGRVADFLQKPDRATLRSHGVLDELGGVLVDTGLLSFCPASVETLCRAAGLEAQGGQSAPGPGLLAHLLSGRGAALNLYEEVLFALPGLITAEEYERRVQAIPRNDDPGHLARLRRLYRDLHGLAFRAAVVPDCDFFHIGTSRELMSGLTGRTRSAATHGFRNLSESAAPQSWPSGLAFAFNSVIESVPVVRGPGVLLEAVHACGPLDLGGRNLVTGLPGAATRPVRLGEGIGLSLLPVGPGDDWAAIVYGVDDGSRPEGECRGEWFLNDPADSFLHRHGLEPEWLWPQGVERTIHAARLWCLGHPDDVLAMADWMLAGEPDRAAVAAWRGRRRWSLAEVIRDVDRSRLLAHRGELRRLASIRSPLARLKEEADLDADRLAGLVRSRGEAADAVADLARGFARVNDPILRARALVLAMHLRRRSEAQPVDGLAQHRIDASCRLLTGDDPGLDALSRATDAAVAEAVAAGVTRPSTRWGRPSARDRAVWATAPARFDLAGGWTDTPPACLVRGGAVVNAAVTLDGRYPIQVFARWNVEGVINLSSLDSGRRARLDRVEQLLDYDDPTDWAALPKACLHLAALASGHDDGEVWDAIRPLGNGIDLTTFSSSPWGSGLGTSSILGAAILGCLARLLGEDLSRHDLIRRTLLLEQRLTTGGGWQDQVGAIFGGVKLIRTRPGADQAPSLSRLAIDGGFARRRMIVFDTGLKRLAKGILHNVTHAYLAGDPGVMGVLDQLEAGAFRLHAALERREFEAIGPEFRRYWELKRRIDRGSATPLVDALIDRVRPHCTGWGLLGAGGGGFLLLVARDDASAEAARAALKPGPPGSRVVDFSIDEKGLELTEV